MLQDLGALLYFETRGFVNSVKTIVREPKRLLAWSLYALLLGNAWLQRSMQRRFTHIGLDHSWFSTLWPAISVIASPALFCLLGYAILASAIRHKPRVGFLWPADGRFLCGSQLSPKIVVMWLQLRVLAMLVLRWPLLLFILVGFPGLATAPLSSVLAGGFAVAAAFLLQWQVSNAVALWSRRARAPLIGLGILVALVGVIGLASPLRAVTLAPAHPVAAIAAHPFRLPPGSLFSAGLAGDWAATGILFLLSLMVAAFATAAASDAYPEMWQASTRLFVLRNIARRGTLWLGDGSWRTQLDAAEGNAKQRALRPTASSVDARLTGAWTLLWKDWVGFRRGPLSGWGQVGRVLLIVLIAGGVGFVLSSSALGAGASEAMLFGLAISGLISYVQILALASAGVTVELRMPFWSLSAAKLPLRLFAWTCAASWRPALGCAVAGVALAVAAHMPVLAYGAVPAAIALTIATRIIGVAAFTILPHQGDARGPAAMLRLLLVYALFLPTAAAGIGAGIFAGLAAGVAAGAVVLAAECFGLLLFAATRLEGNAMAYSPPQMLQTQ